MLYFGDGGKSSVFSFVKTLAKNVFNLSARSFAVFAVVPFALVRGGIDTRVFSRDFAYFQNTFGFLSVQQ